MIVDDRDTPLAYKANIISTIVDSNFATAPT